MKSLLKNQRAFDYLADVTTESHQIRNIEGIRAFLDGKLITDNPYLDEDGVEDEGENYEIYDNYGSWEEGFIFAESETIQASCYDIIKQMKNLPGFMFEEWKKELDENYSFMSFEYTVSYSVEDCLKSLVRFTKYWDDYTWLEDKVDYFKHATEDGLRGYISAALLDVPMVDCNPYSLSNFNDRENRDKYYNFAQGYCLYKHFSDMRSIVNQLRNDNITYEGNFEHSFCNGIGKQNV